MTMGLFVSSDSPSGEVKDHHRFREADPHAVSVLRAVAALFKPAFFFNGVNILSGEPLPDIRNEIGFDASEAFKQFGRFDEIIFLLGKPVEKSIIAIEDEIIVVEKLHIERR